MLKFLPQYRFVLVQTSLWEQGNIQQLESQLTWLQFLVSLKPKNGQSLCVVGVISEIQFIVYSLFNGWLDKCDSVSFWIAGYSTQSLPFLLRFELTRGLFVSFLYWDCNIVFIGTGHLYILELHSAVYPALEIQTILKSVVFPPVCHNFLILWPQSAS